MFELAFIPARGFREVAFVVPGERNLVARAPVGGVAREEGLPKGARAGEVALRDVHERRAVIRGEEFGAAPDCLGVERNRGRGLTGTAKLLGAQCLRRARLRMFHADGGQRLGEPRHIRIAQRCRRRLQKPQ